MLPIDAGIYAQPKVDCHCHVLDPARHPYASDVAYRPAGQETGSAAYFTHVHQAYGVHHALLVGPNSGYGLDNRCLLDTIAQAPARFKGIAVVRHDASLTELQDLQAQGVVGVAFNPSLLGVPFYASAVPLWERLASLNLFINLQIEKHQLAEPLTGSHRLVDALLGSGARILIDHCGRPDLSVQYFEKIGINSFTEHRKIAPGIIAIEQLARSGRAWIKLSGYAKFSAQEFPFTDTTAHLHWLLQTFGPARCLWASDWPFLKAPYRLDYGPLLQLFAATVPDAKAQQQILWDNPRLLFGF
ncbi:MAG: hypothetical protein RLZZ126_1066 [Pseudomonadota bacterium]|jgi:predicted TIM-barrel fold metal-dependent hydrolase